MRDAVRSEAWTRDTGGGDRDGMWRELGNARMVNRAMAGLGQMLVGPHRVEEARQISGEILEFARAHGDFWSERFALHYLADCSLIEGQYDASLELYRRSLAASRAVSDPLETFMDPGSCMSLAGLGRFHIALRLAGAVAAEWERLGADIHVRFWDELLDH